jgi:type I restriction enzyme S subunit
LADVPFEIPDSWEWVKYAELVTNISVKNFQVKSSEIQPIGAFPVVSQGQSSIDGFVDDPKKVIHLRAPIVLFGDHTKIVKYIDFDFVVGADGTKILEAKLAINPKYLYFVTLNIVEKIEDRGYGRHFALLSNSLCPLPPLAEQKRIVDKIEEIFASLDEISLHLV